MKRRVFLALDLPPELKQTVEETVKQWRWLPIRWLQQKHWHITLIPPVYVEDDEVGRLTALLQKSRIGKQFAVRFSRISLAPPGVPARMIWLEGATPPELVQLKKKLEALWRSDPALPLPKEESRALSLHVTLARFEPGELKELGEKTRVLGEVSWQCRAEGVTVFESHLVPSGADYEALAVIPLAHS